MSIHQSIERAWYRADPKLIILRPLSCAYLMLHKHIKQRKQKQAWRAPVPVVVVGNISVGGSGKTPAVVAIVEALIQRGYQPAVISRGYKSQAPYYPYFVEPSCKAQVSGDEPLLIAQRTACPVVIGANRKRCIDALLKAHKIDVIVSDDGLQHYQLARDVEICMLDLKRGLGNRRCLPEGPLREPIARLAEVDFILANHNDAVLEQYSSTPHFITQLEAQPLRRLSDDSALLCLQQDVHAVAGIAGPERFFDYLRELGYKPIEHSFSDHHQYCKADFDFDIEPSLPVIMTEKDAVKCRQLELDHAYYLPVSLTLNPEFYSQLIARLE